MPGNYCTDIGQHDNKFEWGLHNWFADNTVACALQYRMGAAKDKAGTLNFKGGSGRGTKRKKSPSKPATAGSAGGPQRSAPVTIILP